MFVFACTACGGTIKLLSNVPPAAHYTHGMRLCHGEAVPEIDPRFAAAKALARPSTEEEREAAHGPIQRAFDVKSAQAMPDVEGLMFQIECLKEEIRLTERGRWIFEDPRHTIYKRCNIIILRPAGPAGIWHAGTGHVETKNGWSITTSFEDHRTIPEWDPSWCWARAPGDPLGPPVP